MAADESTGTIGKRFDGISVENNEENRRAYRELLLTTEGSFLSFLFFSFLSFLFVQIYALFLCFPWHLPNSKGLEEHISGVILFEESLFHKTKDGVLFVDVLKKKGIAIGIKVDMVCHFSFPLFLSSEIDLRIRESNPSEGPRVRPTHKGGITLLPAARSTTKLVLALPSGIIFFYLVTLLHTSLSHSSLRRAVLKIDEKDGLPSQISIEENATGLARYGAICQVSFFFLFPRPSCLSIKINKQTKHFLNVLSCRTTGWCPSLSPKF